MENFKDKAEKYAELIIKIGIQIKDGDSLVIKCPIENADFARLVVEKAYKSGAHEVIVNWYDDTLNLLNYTYSPVEVMENIPQYLYDKNEYYYKKGAKFLSIYSENPELLKDINPEKIQKVSMASSLKMKPLMKYTMNDICSWCVVSVPTFEWAKKVFPNEENPIDAMWNAIFTATRINSKDPIKAWEDHLTLLSTKAKWLNDNAFKYLVYKASNGTDLKIELPKGHIWTAASSKNAVGDIFVPNMPTEEIFTLPKRDGVNGRVYSSKPLAYNGNLIDKFWFEFKDGKIVDFGAEEGYEALASIFKQDERARMLGEVALVPYDSPISNLNILFFNTLFDENASCHLAVGKAYPTTIENGENMTEEELLCAGVNDSFIHEDFMIGTFDLSITGIREDGCQVEIFKNGNWA